MSDEFKACTKCGGLKPLTAFWKDNRPQRRYKSHCIECNGKTKKSHLSPADRIHREIMIEQLISIAKRAPELFDMAISQMEAEQ